MTKFYFILLLLFPLLTYGLTTTMENNISNQTKIIESEIKSTESIQPKQQNTVISQNTDHRNSRKLVTINTKNTKPTKKLEYVRKTTKIKQQQQSVDKNKNKELEVKLANDLNSIFNRLISTSNNYNSPKGIIYKVIPANNLSAFWEQAIDSLKVNSETIKKQKKEVKNLQLKIESLILTISKKDDNIKSSQIQNSLIYIFGTPLSKFTFKILFFSIISILTLLLFYLIYLYKKSHFVTKEAVKDKKEIEDLLSLERQKRSDDVHKLRRELQTERNLLNELKKKG